MRTNRTPLATAEIGRWYLEVTRGPNGLPYEAEATAPHPTPGEQPFRLVSRGSSVEQAIDLLRQHVKLFELTFGDDHRNETGREGCR